MVLPVGLSRTFHRICVSQCTWIWFIQNTEDQPGKSAQCVSNKPSAGLERAAPGAALPHTLRRGSAPRPKDCVLLKIEGEAQVTRRDLGPWITKAEPKGELRPGELWNIKCPEGDCTKVSPGCSPCPSCSAISRCPQTLKILRASLRIPDNVLVTKKEK